MAALPNNNNGPPPLSLVRANAQGRISVANNQKVATQQTLRSLPQMGIIAPHQISTASITGNVAAKNAANAAAMKNNSKNSNNMNVNGGRRRSRHAKKTRRNKRHAKKTRRNRKH